MKLTEATKNFFIQYFATGIFLMVAFLTRPYYYADSYEYVHTILNHEAGKPAPLFLESSHAIWRPIGLAAHNVLHSPVSAFLNLFMLSGSSPFAEVSASLMFVVFVLTITGIFYLYRLLRLFPLSEDTVHASVLIYVVSQCVVDYSRTGTSYMAGLSVLIIGMFYALRYTEGTAFKDFLAGGILLAVVPFLWLPYILALPAAFFARPLIYGWKKKNVKGSLKLIGISVVACILIFLPIAIYLNMSSFADAMKWFFRPKQSSPTAGPQRAFFGLSKTLFYLGDDGLYIKRFLYHDAYNPVSFLLLARLGLWKVALFYSLLATSLITILRHPTARKYLPVLIIGFLPTLALSVVWDGSALERDMPLLPFLFIALAFMLEYGSKPVKLIFVIASVATAIVNLSGMWYASSHDDKIKVDEKIAEIWPRINDRSLVAVISGHDELAKFQGINPFDLYNQSPRLQTYSLVSMGYDSARFWRQKFDSACARSWSNGGDVWVSRTLLAPTPTKETYWIEGADPVSWHQIEYYFRELPYSDSTKDFLLLKRWSIAIRSGMNNNAGIK